MREHGIVTQASFVSIVSLRIPGRLDYRELATRAAALVCRVATERAPARNDADRRELTNQLVSAVGEAFNNAVLHAYAGSVAGDVEISLEFDEQRIVVEVIDFGASFTPDRVAEPDLGSLPVSGMGLYIIRNFVDRFEYLPGPPNFLRLTKFLSPETARR